MFLQIQRLEHMLRLKCAFLFAERGDISIFGDWLVGITDR